jgi:PTH2 family peptidyl-tRNA hydrolase
MIEYKQVILVRRDLKLSKGKTGSQVSHASVEATLKSDSNKVKAWRNKGMKKVILKVDNEKELLGYKKLADEMKLTNFLVRDAGRTELKPGTLTCLAIGPDEVKKINSVSGELQML